MGLHRITAALAALCLGACAQTKPLPRPAEGYAALRVLQPLQFPHALGAIILTAGTTLVADQATDAGPVFCGMIYYRELGLMHPFHTCAMLEGTALVLNAEKPINQTFQVPPIAIERTRI